MAEKTDVDLVVLRISDKSIGTAEWTLPENVQKMFREFDAYLATEPEEIKQLLRDCWESLISDYTNNLQAFLHLLSGVILLPPGMIVAGDAIMRNMITEAASDLQKLLHDQMPNEIMH